MRIDGKQIRDRIKAELHREVSALSSVPQLSVISVGENPVVRGFINIKKRFAEEIGVVFTEDIFSYDVTFSQLQKRIEELSNATEVTGIIVQLPLPSHLDTEMVLNLIPVSKDVDVLSREANAFFENGESFILPPVVGAIKEICEEVDLKIRGKKVLVIGHGRLVGAPSAVWFRKQGGEVTVLGQPTENLAEITRYADIIVCGVGSAGLIKPDMLKDGVILLDAGTSEEGGLVVGDADPRCEDVAGVFTPVPCGIGPITVAMIFRNLILLLRNR